MTKEPLTILIDGDMVAFRASSAVEVATDWGEGLWTLHADQKEAQDVIDAMVDKIVNNVISHTKWQGRYEVKMCMSSSENFRKQILSTYKLNRKDKRKPVCYSGILKWLDEVYDTVLVNTLEADDVVGILATTYKDKAVMVSGDKDFRCIPGLLFNFLNNEWYDISKEEADRYFLYQTLLGDSTDNYKGCPGVGAVGAKKLLDKECSWANVVAAFERKGLTEEDALQQARVARILRVEDWDKTNNKVKLWEPNRGI